MNHPFPFSPYIKLIHSLFKFFSLLSIPCLLIIFVNIFIFQFEQLLNDYVMPHAYSRGSRLPFSETSERVRENQIQKNITIQPIHHIQYTL